MGMQCPGVNVPCRVFGVEADTMNPVLFAGCRVHPMHARCVHGVDDAFHPAKYGRMVAMVLRRISGAHHGDSHGDCKPGAKALNVTDDTWRKHASAIFPCETGICMGLP
jgi:hypothetical protein